MTEQPKTVKIFVFYISKDALNKTDHILINASFERQLHIIGGIK
jgi:hypothetical protein